MNRVRDKKVTLVDVRPASEFTAAHIPGARNIPIEQLDKRGSLDNLPQRGEIVVYCRGAYCVWADEAVEFLQRRGFRAHRLLVGPADWAALGEKVATGS
ncbi:MAG TPA: rhodanese-like domain-containing protein [Candidatus Baltobacteraceae bacterium]